MRLMVSMTFFCWWLHFLLSLTGSTRRRLQRITVELGLIVEPFESMPSSRRKQEKAGVVGR